MPQRQVSIQENAIWRFGVKNAPAVFQGIVDEAIKDCRDCSSRTYIDDMVVFSSTWSDHLTHLRKVLNALRKSWIAC